MAKKKVKAVKTVRAVEAGPPLPPLCLTLDVDAPRVSEEHVRAAVRQLEQQGPGALRQLAERRFFWDKKLLKVVFIDRSPSQKLMTKVEEFSQEWCKWTDLKFEFARGVSVSGDITITFQGARIFQSYLGTGSLQHRPSMTLGFDGSEADSELNHLILHEFGHALGLHHEHQNPRENPIRWNRQAVLKYYRQRTNWPDDMIFTQVISRLEDNIRNYLIKRFDPLSIMLYDFPPEVTEDGVGTKRNLVLSQADKEIVAEMYGKGPGWKPNDKPEVKPGEETESKEIEVDGPAVSGTVGGNRVNKYHFTAKEPAGFLLETKGTTDVVLGLYGPKDEDIRIRERDFAGGEHGNERMGLYLYDKGKYFVRVRASEAFLGSSGSYTLTVKKET